MAAEPRQRFLCHVSDIPLGGARALAPGPELSLFAVRTADHVHVYRNRCPHAGFELNWLPDRFLDRSGRYIHCQVHGALFEIDSGTCLAGPCPGARLEQVAVRERGGALYLDLDAGAVRREPVSTGSSDSSRAGGPAPGPPSKPTALDLKGATTMTDIADQLAIRQVVARYNRAFDYGDPEAWVATFAADGTFAMGGKQLAAGQEALLAFARKMIPTMKVKHCTTDAIVEVDGDTASHDAYLILVDTGDKVSVVNSGRYRDQLVKVGGVWKFQSRVVEIDGKM